MIDAVNQTLTETLWQLGLCHHKIDDRGNHAVTQAHRVIFTGKAHQVWDWLRQTERIK